MNSYKDAIAEEMEWLGKQDNVMFMGQSVAYPGHYMSQTLSGVPMEKRIELPVAEELQMGMTLGLALGGFFPISIYPRMDFLILALNQLVNHIDKIEQMTGYEFEPRGIIRTSVGPNKPLDAGPQHTQNHTNALIEMLHSIFVCIVHEAKDAMEYRRVYETGAGFTLFIEDGSLY